MGCKIAIINLKKVDTSVSKPLMLHALLFCPVLSWISRDLQTCGVERFFIICDETWRAEASKALSDVPETVFFDDAISARAAAEGDIVVIPSAVLPFSENEDSPVYRVSAGVLSDNISVRPEDAEILPGYTSFDSVLQLQKWMPRCREKILSSLAENGVMIIDPTTTYIDPRCQIASDVTILPGTILRGNTVIERGCEIGPNSMISNCQIGEATTVNSSQLNDSTVGSFTTVGPFAYIRPNCRVGNHCRIGDFVELKNSVLDDGTKVSHLTYVGDSDIGKRVNFGCGTVTTNYDGIHKYRCTVGDDVFLGCNTNLVAPVTVGDGAYTAAGSTITGEVPAGALAIARAKQVNKEGWAKRFFTMKKK